MQTKTVIKTDCVYYKGHKPCLYHVEIGVLCGSCIYYRKISQKTKNIRTKLLRAFLKQKKGAGLFKKVKRFGILIIKFGATGDVLRTTPVLKSLKNAYPSSHITWIADRNSAALLKGSRLIDRIVIAGSDSFQMLLKERFNLVLSLDKDNRAIALATAVSAGKKLGFKADSFGGLNVFNKNSIYALLLGIDNRLKYVDNKKTYQKIVYEMSELKGRYGNYLLDTQDEYSDFGRKALFKHGIKPSHIVIGLNTGAGRIFPTKKWPVEHFIKLISLLKKEKNVKIVLLGGSDEKRLNKTIAKKAKGKVVNTGTGFSLKEFTGIIDQCDIIVSADTLCMHLAIAQKKEIAALFGPTTEKEVDLYGLGKKLYSTVPCSPCYKSKCANTICMKSITPAKVFSEIKNMIKRL